ncbi:hypothetical protein ABZP36_009186 [Zizania latifolia]
MFDDDDRRRRRDAHLARLSSILGKWEAYQRLGGDSVDDEVDDRGADQVPYHGIHGNGCLLDASSNGLRLGEDDDRAAAMDADETHHYDEDAIVVSSSWDEFSCLPSQEEFTRAYTAVTAYGAVFDAGSTSSGMHHHGDEIPASAEDSGGEAQEQIVQPSSLLLLPSGEEVFVPRVDTDYDGVGGASSGLYYHISELLSAEELNAVWFSYTAFNDDYFGVGASSSSFYDHPDELSPDAGSESPEQKIVQAQVQQGGAERTPEPLEMATLFLQGNSNSNEAIAAVERMVQSKAATQRRGGASDGSGGDLPDSAASVGAPENHEHGDGDEASDDDATCVICFEDYKEGEDTSVMPCSSRHRFHEACLNTWFEQSRSCPLCRYELPAEELPAAAASEDDDAEHSEYDPNFIDFHDDDEDGWALSYDSEYYYGYYFHFGEDDFINVQTLD